MFRFIISVRQRQQSRRKCPYLPAQPVHLYPQAGSGIWCETVSNKSQRRGSDGGRAHLLTGCSGAFVSGRLGDDPYAAVRPAGPGRDRIAYTYSLTNAYVPRLLKGFLGNEGKGCVIYSDEMPSDQIAQQPQNRIINNAGASNSILITKTYWSPSSKNKNPAC